MDLIPCRQVHYHLVKKKKSITALYLNEEKTKNCEQKQDYQLRPMVYKVGYVHPLGYRKKLIESLFLHRILMGI